MNILMTGIDHNLAPVEVRERFSFTTNQKAELMQQVMSYPNYDGCILLGTCNRTELWVSYQDDEPGDLPALLIGSKGLDPAAYREYFTVRSDLEAVRYLFEVTSGLKSRIIGEDQILAQVKSALTESRDAGCCCGVLDVLFRSAVTAAKKVKTELAISTANASAVELALAQMVESGMDFRGKHCLVIGNGEMGKRTATALLTQGANVTVTIRQYRSGQVQVVPGCERINYGDRYSLIPDCDVVVSATSSPNTTITMEELSKCDLKEGVVFIDLAVPRDIEPEIRTLTGVTLYDIDHFTVVETDELKLELAQARTMLAEQENRFINWYECRDLLPRLDDLAAYFGSEVTGRLGGALNSMSLEAGSRAELSDALEDTCGKVFKKLIFAVRDQAGIDLFRACIDAMEGVGRIG